MAVRRVGTAVGLLAAMSLNGCVVNAYTIAHDAKKQDPAFMAAYTDCGEETAALGLIPDLGVTREAHFFKCMRQAGWVMPDRWNRNPAALGYYQRVDQ